MLCFSMLCHATLYYTIRSPRISEPRNLACADSCCTDWAHLVWVVCVQATILNVILGAHLVLNVVCGLLCGGV